MLFAIYHEEPRHLLGVLRCQLPDHAGWRVLSLACSHPSGAHQIGYPLRPSRKLLEVPRVTGFGSPSPAERFSPLRF